MLALAADSGSPALVANTGTEGVQDPGRFMGLLGAGRKELHDLDVVVQHRPGLWPVVIDDPDRAAHDIVLDFVDNILQLPAVRIVRANEQLGHVEILTLSARLATPGATPAGRQAPEYGPGGQSSK